MMNAIQSISSTNKNKLKAGIFFGYTRNQQTGGKIPGYPAEKLKVICKFDDVLCWGLPLISVGHLLYGTDVNAGVAFLTKLLGSL